MYTNPYEAVAISGGSWRKANFHVHSAPEGSGRHPEPEEVVRIYKQSGYDVLTLSNHSELTDTKAFGEKYDILTINGTEYIGYDGILCIGTKSLISGNPQEVVTECARQGGFSVICHPNLQWEEGLLPLLSEEARDSLNGFVGIEILTPVVYHRFKGSGLATDLWDRFLTAGKLVWGFANDDSHKYCDMDRAWNMVYSESRTFESIKSAIGRGSFYASTGLFLHEISYRDGKFSLAAGYRNHRPDSIRYTFYGANGRLLYETTGETGTWQTDGSEPYIRARAMSEHGAALWTQPVYDASRLKPVRFIDPASV